MNGFALEVRSFHVQAGEEVHVTKQVEFMVDGVGLSARLGFEGLRPMFGATCFEWPPEVREARVRALCGLGPAHSQLGRGRAVLYGCHCGADYCGVISCVVTWRGDEVWWEDVRLELDDEGDDEVEGEGGDDGWGETRWARVEVLRFDAAQLEAECARFAARWDAGRG